MPVPAGVVTATFTGPAAWAGVVQVIVWASTTTRLVAAEPPNVTDDALVKVVPVIVTGVPPEVFPKLGVQVATTGRMPE